MTFFPPGNRSKPGERHSYSPRHGIKGKREPRAGNAIKRIREYSDLEYVRDYQSKFHFIPRNSKNGFFICTGKELSPEVTELFFSESIS